MSEYTEQAEKFLKDTGTKLTVKYVTNDKYFADDKESRDIYRFTLKRNGKRYTGKFGQSIAHAGEEPTAYDVLACLTKSDPGTFEDFCSEYGYDTDSIKATKVYKDVVKEWQGVSRLFSDVIEPLAEIA